MEGNTKVRFNLKENIIELEGSEAFVSNQMEWLKDIILNPSFPPENQIINEKLEETEIFPQIIGSQTTGITPVNCTSDKYKSLFGIEKELLESVIHMEEKSFTIITKKIKGGTAEKQLQYSLLYCLASEFYGQLEVDSTELRDLCQNNACLDAGNFMRCYISHKDMFITNGKPRAKNKIIKLTSPGRNKAKEILNSLAV